MTVQSILSGRERMQRVFARQDHDRVPRYDCFWRETIERWNGEGLQGDTETIHRQHLHADLACVGGSWIAPFPGRREVIREDEQTVDYIDSYGATVRYWKNKSGTPEHLAFGCDSPEAWRRDYRPAFERYLPQIDEATVCANYRRVCAEERWVCLTTLEAFEGTRRILGDVVSWMGMVEEPDWLREVSRVWTDATLRGLDRLVELGVKAHGLWCYGDMAFNHATVCSPQTYRDVMWEDHKRLADWAHAHDMKFIFHTDGNVNGVLDLYEQAGFDCLQPLEAKAGMDIRQLCPQRGERLALFGNIDVMVMATNNLDALDAELKSKLEAGMATRGYIYHSDHSVPPGVSWATYQHLIQRLDQWGQYA